MLSRAVVVLCLLTGSALACPMTFETPEAQAEHEAQLMRAEQSPAPRELNDDAHGVAVAIMLMGFCGFAFVVTRARTVRRSFDLGYYRQTQTNLDVIAAIARIQRVRALTTIAGCLVAMLAINSLPIASETRIVLTVVPGMFLAIGVTALLRLQMLVRLRPDPTLIVRDGGYYWFVARGGELVGWVGSSPQLLSRAGGLPLAKVRT